MTIEEASKAMQNKQPVYYMGDCYDIIYCKYSTAGDVVLVQRRSLNNRFGPVPIEPRYLSLGANDVWANYDYRYHYPLDCDAASSIRTVRLVANFGISVEYTKLLVYRLIRAVKPVNLEMWWITI